jgi:peptidoglycan-associated lipoprotein
MNRHLILKLSVVTALGLTAACSKKEVVELPPPPQDSPQVAQPTQPTVPAYQGPVPGSREDFLAKAGSDRVFFDTDAYDIDATDRVTLDAQAAWMQQYPTVTATIEGHCDERGTREYNLALGDRRANAAKNYLASRGISPSRLSTISYGKERPAAMGSDEESWAQNRRAVTVVLSSAGY